MASSTSPSNETRRIPVRKTDDSPHNVEGKGWKTTRRSPEKAERRGYYYSIPTCGMRKQSLPTILAFLLSWLSLFSVLQVNFAGLESVASSSFLWSIDDEPSLNHTTGLSHHPSTTTASSGFPWVDLHIQEQQEMKERLWTIQRSLASRFVTLKHDSDDSKSIIKRTPSTIMAETLSISELQRAFDSLLRQRGLIIIGDSTARYLFGALWCIMEGRLPGDECTVRQKQLFRACRPTGHCNIRAFFQEAPIEDTTNGFDDGAERHQSKIYLEYHASDRFSWNQETHEALLQSESQRIVFWFMPCLHSLWAPGCRETSVKTVHTEWSRELRRMYRFLREVVFSQNATSKRSVMIGTTVSLCDERMGDYKTLMDAYLQETELIAGSSHTHTVLKMYNGRCRRNAIRRLSGDTFNGTLVPVKPVLYGNHRADWATFDETGSVSCSMKGLEVLSELLSSERKVENTEATSHLMSPPLSTPFWSSDTNIMVADIHGATANACNFTRDGRHYVEGPPLERELSVVLKTMQSLASNTITTTTTTTE